jgi:hypothetical protein
LTIAGLVDSFIFNGAKRLKGEDNSGFGAPNGKMVSTAADSESGTTGLIDLVVSRQSLYMGVQHEYHLLCMTPSSSCL